MQMLKNDNSKKNCRKSKRMQREKYQRLKHNTSNCSRRKTAQINRITRRIANRTIARFQSATKTITTKGSLTQR